MMSSLELTEGSLIHVSSITLPKGEFVKIQPQSKDFLDLTNPRAVLEALLRNYSALGKNEQICLHYNQKEYWLIPKEVKPISKYDAISIVETDIQVRLAVLILFSCSINLPI